MFISLMTVHFAPAIHPAWRISTQLGPPLTRFLFSVQTDRHSTEGTQHSLYSNCEKAEGGRMQTLQLKTAGPGIGVGILCIQYR